MNATFGLMCVDYGAGIVPGHGVPSLPLGLLSHRGIEMKVCYDEQIFVTQRRGGISRYFVELIRAFQANPLLDVEAQLGWRWTHNQHALEAGLGRPLWFPGGSKGRVVRWANKLADVSCSNAELEHHTYHRAEYLPSDSDVPLITTVYDMTPELFPELFPGGNPHQQKAEYVKRARVVLCISESTRRDLVKIYGAIESHVAVTHLGVSKRFAPGKPRPAWSPEKYVLFVGSRGGYKDFRVALESFAQVSRATPGTVLLAVGGGPFRSDEEELISRWGLGSTVIHREVRDDELPGVFGGASVFIFPSRYEGFGLPTLEAMASGTPVVLADSSSHPEVGGDAALYFPPGDTSALADRLLRLLADQEFRKDVSRKSVVNARRFTWERTARGTAEAYGAAMGPT